jgi:hypothetical protein
MPWLIGQGDGIEESLWACYLRLIPFGIVPRALDAHIYTNRYYYLLHINKGYICSPYFLV